MTMPVAAAQCPLPKFVPDFVSQQDINRVGDAFCASSRDVSAVHAVQQYRMFRMGCLATTLRMVDVAKMPSHCLVSVRLKRLDSIQRKIKRPNAKFTLGQMDDIIGVRIICPTFGDVCALNKRIQSMSEFYRAKDYTRAEHAADTGYRAAHSIMRFEQALTEKKFVNVRFEIQVRSFYQHQWAIWSEAKGESVKVGGGSEQEHSELRALSQRIACWEEVNSGKEQAQLPAYVGGRSIAVAWRQKPEPMFSFFQRDVDLAVQYLNYLEVSYPAERGNALLLVGVSGPEDARKVLRQTHPLYTISRVIPPEFWMPSGS